MRLIDKDVIITEIERRIKSVNSCPFGTAELGSEKLKEGQLNAYNVILSEIDILEVKEMDLESEMDKYFETMEVLEHEYIFEDTFQRIAKHFFELGLKAKEK